MNNKIFIISLPRTGTYMLASHIKNASGISYCNQHFPWDQSIYEDIPVNMILDEFERIIVLGRRDVFAMILSQCIAAEKQSWIHTFKESRSTDNNKLMPTEMLECPKFIIPYHAVRYKINMVVNNYLPWIEKISNIYPIEFYWYEDLVSNDICHRSFYQKNKYDNIHHIKNYEEILQFYNLRYRKSITSCMKRFNKFCEISDNVRYNDFRLL